jgi:hypothetical protein
MKNLLLLPVIMLLMSCAGPRIAFDYDKQADFAKYKTYAISDETKDLQINQLNRDRIIAAVENEMALKGFTKSDKPDVIVDVHLKGQEITTATATTTGYGGYRRYGYGGGFGTTQIDYNTYVEGTMFITLIDLATEKIVWQGTGTKTVDENASTEKREKNINSIVKQILINYPPKAK